MSPEQLRVIVIGLDGATLDLILPWVQTGHLPHFRKLIEEGVWGELESTLPPLTGPAWSSFMTGNNPGKHGIFDFMHRNPEGYNWITFNATQRNGPPFWRTLSDYGKKVIIFNVPGTYPPEKVNGILISGYLTPPKATDFVFPSELKKDLEKEIGFRSTFYPGATYSLGREKKFIKAIEDMTDRTIRVMDYLMKHFSWDCFVGVFQSPDLLQHCLWKDFHHPVFGAAFLKLYEQIDTFLGRLKSFMDEQTILMVLSDHGFGDLKKQVFLNTWLLSEGFLKLKSNPMGRFKKAIFDVGLVPMKLHQLSVRLGIDLSNKMMENKKSFFSFVGKVALSLEDVDWERTKAYAMGNMGYLSVNLQGREPRGYVKPGTDYQNTLRDLKEALSGLEDPESGERIVDHVYHREDLYQGPHLCNAPDLLPVPTKFQYHLRGDYVFISNHSIEKFWLISGGHRPKGIFMAGGIPVRKGLRLEGKRILDIAPTILTYLGVPMSQDIDGKPMLDLLVDEFSRNLSPQYVHPSQDSAPHETVLSEEDQEEIQKRLRSLGYV